jgi:hypothetical protein
MIVISFSLEPDIVSINLVCPFPCRPQIRQPVSAMILLIIEQYKQLFIFLEQAFLRQYLTDTIGGDTHILRQIEYSKDSCGSR